MCSVSITLRLIIPHSIFAAGSFIWIFIQRDVNSCSFAALSNQSPSCSSRKVPHKTHSCYFLFLLSAAHLSSSARPVSLGVGAILFNIGRRTLVLGHWKATLAFYNRIQGIQEKCGIARKKNILASSTIFFLHFDLAGWSGGSICIMLYLD